MGCRAVTDTPPRPERDWTRVRDARVMLVGCSSGGIGPLLVACGRRGRRWTIATGPNWIAVPVGAAHRRRLGRKGAAHVAVGLRGPATLGGVGLRRRADARVRVRSTKPFARPNAAIIRRGVSPLVIVIVAVPPGFGEGPAHPETDRAHGRGVRRCVFAVGGSVPTVAGDASIFGDLAGRLGKPPPLFR